MSDDNDDVEAEVPPHRGLPAFIPLDRIDIDDDTFKLRPEGELSHLATDLARLGQLFPVDLRLKPPDRFQVVCGFRRVAALRFLQREKVWARLHTDLSDDDALLMSLAAVIHPHPIGANDLQALRARLEGENRLGVAAKEMLDRAISGGNDLAPESVDEEVDAEDLAEQLAIRLGDINQDLAALADVFGSLDDRHKTDLIKQLRYSSELVAFLEARFDGR